MKILEKFQYNLFVYNIIVCRVCNVESTASYIYTNEEEKKNNLNHPFNRRQKKIFFQLKLENMKLDE